MPGKALPPGGWEREGVRVCGGGDGAFASGVILLFDLFITLKQGRNAQERTFPVGHGLW